MKSSSLALKILAPLAFVFLAACNPFPSSTPSATNATVDPAEVRTAVDTYIAKVNARDAVGAGELFANDPAFRWIASGRVVYDSRATAIQGLTNFLAGFPESVFKVHDIKVDAIGDAEAIATLTFTQTVGANGQTAMTFDGILTLTLVKREEAWRIIQGHASTGQLPH